MENKAYGWVLIIVIFLLIGSSIMMHSHLHVWMGIIVMILFWMAVIWLILELANERTESIKPIERLKVKNTVTLATKKQFKQRKKNLLKKVK